jgi:hypothetical protein
MKKLMIVVVLLLCPTLLYAQSCPRHLFYIGKSDNKNVLYYDANIKNGVINSKNPVTIYWVLENKKTEGLGRLEKSQFGINFKTVKEGTEYTFNVKNDMLKNKTISLKVDENGCAVATAKVKGTDSVLTRVFVQIAPDSGIVPDVQYLDIFGKSVAGGSNVSERIVNPD